MAHTRLRLLQTQTNVSAIDFIADKKPTCR